MDIKAICIIVVSKKVDGIVQPLIVARVWDAGDAVGAETHVR